MARFEIPANTGKVRLAMGMAGTWAVWNGKQGGRDEFKILVRTRKQAEELVRIINGKAHDGWVEVLDGGTK